MQEISNSNINDNVFKDPTFYIVPGVNSPQIDYNKLKNKKQNNVQGISPNHQTSSSISQGQFVLDIWQKSGTKPDGTLRLVRAGNPGDILEAYTDVNILGNGNMNATITKKTSLGDLPIQIKKGDIIYARARFYESGTFVLSPTFTYRTLYKNGISLDKTNDMSGIIATDDGELDIKYGDPTQGNFIASITLTIT